MLATVPGAVPTSWHSLNVPQDSTKCWLSLALIEWDILGLRVQGVKLWKKEKPRLASVSVHKSKRGERENKSSEFHILKCGTSGEICAYEMIGSWSQAKEIRWFCCGLRQFRATSLKATLPPPAWSFLLTCGAHLTPGT